MLAAGNAKRSRSRSPWRAMSRDHRRLGGLRLGEPERLAGLVPQTPVQPILGTTRRPDVKKFIAAVYQLADPLLRTN